ncbi:hypothetical protein AB0395_44770 [Streptosporangium sp. NPDC051023]|uniref:hypothetical protein n=1 Tax=Streptosporangium sp. NPDC051023 TaxID=3155410 RepID=UPI00344F600A
MTTTARRPPAPLDAWTGAAVAAAALLLGAFVALGRPYFVHALGADDVRSWIVPILALGTAADVAAHMWQTGTLRRGSALTLGAGALLLLAAVLAWRLS